MPTFSLLFLLSHILSIFLCDILTLCSSPFSQSLFPPFLPLYLTPSPAMFNYFSTLHSSPWSLSVYWFNFTLCSCPSSIFVLAAMSLSFCYLLAVCSFFSISPFTCLFGSSPLSSPVQILYSLILLFCLLLFVYSQDVLFILVHAISIPLVKHFSLIFSLSLFSSHSL